MRILISVRDYCQKVSKTLLKNKVAEQRKHLPKEYFSKTMKSLLCYRRYIPDNKDQQENRSEKFKPGIISNTLREALGMLIFVSLKTTEVSMEHLIQPTPMQLKDSQLLLQE